jgi:hypothetical protein
MVKVKAETLIHPVEIGYEASRGSPPVLLVGIRT